MKVAVLLLALFVVAFQDLRVSSLPADPRSHSAEFSGHQLPFHHDRAEFPSHQLPFHHDGAALGLRQRSDDSRVADLRRFHHRHHNFHAENSHEFFGTRISDVGPLHETHGSQWGQRKAESQRGNAFIR